MSEAIVLFGAGAAGRWALSHLRSQGIEPMCFADNHGFASMVGGLPVHFPQDALDRYPGAIWVACSIKHEFAQEIRDDMVKLGVKSKPLWECLPVCHGIPCLRADWTVRHLLSDGKSRSMWDDQSSFRRKPDYDRQQPPSDIKDIYFPDFIQPVADEHFVDAGAADGDTVHEFLQRWGGLYARVTAIEPDLLNYRAFCEREKREMFGPHVKCWRAAASDHEGRMSFVQTGDYSAHLGGSGKRVRVCKLDDLLHDEEYPPTYIKMDIEGAELEALWGARHILKEHMPVLAVCAYHTSEHLWQIPLLIHAIQPEYRLFFRRYAEGAFELVWYAVPPERVR